MATILFLHGWNSVPGGVKPTYLADHGHRVLNPKLDDDDFDAALAVAQTAFDLHRPDVVVGSSRGGAIALNIQSGAIPLVLICPAWKRWGTVNTLKPNSLILHSRVDDVVPFSNSEELIANSGLPGETLIEVGNDHRLADETSLSVLLWACEVLASGERIPSAGYHSGNYGTSNSTGDPASNQEASYICDACGEEIVIPLDLTEGEHQLYVEDCPVCCRANKIHVEIEADGEAHVWAEPEQDHD